MDLPAQNQRSALAFLGSFLSTLLLFTFVHLAAASSRVLTFSGVCCVVVSLSYNAPLHQRQPQYFLLCTQFFVQLLTSIPHQVSLECIFLLVGFWPPSSPFLPFPRRETIRNFILLCHRASRIMIPRVPYFDLIVDVSFVALPPGPDDVVQLRLPFLTFFLFIGA